MNTIACIAATIPASSACAVEISRLDFLEAQRLGSIERHEYAAYKARLTLNADTLSRLNEAAIEYDAALIELQYCY